VFIELGGFTGIEKGEDHQKPSSRKGGGGGLNKWGGRVVRKMKDHLRWDL